MTSYDSSLARTDEKSFVDNMAVESNDTCKLIRHLYQYDDGSPVVFTSDRLAGSDDVKYLLENVVNPALCVVWLLLVTPDLPIFASGLDNGR